MAALDRRAGVVDVSLRRYAVVTCDDGMGVPLFHKLDPSVT